MDRNPNSQSMGSTFSSPNPETLDSKIDPPLSAPGGSGSNQDPRNANPNPETLDCKMDPPSSAPAESGSNQDPENPNPNSSEIEESFSADVGSNQDVKDPKGVVEGKQDEEEEEGECGFCLFMKAGGCKDEFVAWEKCVEDAEKSGYDIVEKCFEVSSLLKKCMDAHADYYEPIISVEKAMEESIAEEEKAQKDSETEAAKVVVAITLSSES